MPRARQDLSETDYPPQGAAARDEAQLTLLYIQDTFHWSTALRRSFDKTRRLTPLHLPVRSPVCHASLIALA